MLYRLQYERKKKWNWKTNTYHQSAEKKPNFSLNWLNLNCLYFIQSFNFRIFFLNIFSEKEKTTEIKKETKIYRNRLNFLLSFSTVICTEIILPKKKKKKAFTEGKELTIAVFGNNFLFCSFNFFFCLFYRHHMLSKNLRNLKIQKT